MGDVCIVGVATTPEAGISLMANALPEQQPPAADHLETNCDDAVNDGQNAIEQSSQATQIASHVEDTDTATAPDDAADMNASQDGEPQMSPEATQEPRHRRRSRIRAIRQQYQNEVGQGFLSLQTKQQEQLGRIYGSLTELVNAVNRVAAAQEQQTIALQEIIGLLTVSTHLFLYALWVRSIQNLQTS
ncbi:uncharacterized protein LOC135383718 isoform X1 [Ornithodoros turicata]|uniref:uncharacterized protein LOC135383718 isoform X1 n=1 Tax=Ornithodoros turicata TaxID=34597 RepID=UPI003138AAF8